MMSVPRFLIFVLIITASFHYFTLCSGNDEAVICPRTEKQALLSFMNTLKNPDNIDQFFSWNQTNADCCTWEGVVCSNITGNVVELHLQDSFLNGKLGDSLTNLRHLKYLDLSLNDFQGTIPAFLGTFAELEYLDLSNAGFQGTLPHALGNLSSLRTLALAQSENSYALDVDSIEWLSGLSHLEHLDMNDLNLSKAATTWPQVINTLPSLLYLSLVDCLLYDEVAPSLDQVNFTSLAYLDLSDNHLQSMPRWIFQLSKLTYLQLTANRIQGSIPSALGNLTSLNSLGLSRNVFSGDIPSEIVRLCNMQVLDLSYNFLRGNISNMFGNMSKCFSGTLEVLNLKQNQLYGHLTDKLEEFKSLKRLDLGNNSFDGQIPRNLGKLSALEEMRLDINEFSGNLPESMGQLSNLEGFYVNLNNLQGTVTETHFANLRNLTVFVASGNLMTFNVSASWIPCFSVEILRLVSWNIGANGQIPAWLHTQKDSISFLDLSYTGLASRVPDWFWKVTSLDLSHNQLYGNIPDLVEGPEYGSQYIYVGSNLFSGTLPRIGVIVFELDLSDNLFTGGLSHFVCGSTRNETYQLQAIRLRNNKLSGDLPDCWMKWPALKALNLGNNSLSGSIPNSIGLLKNLLFLDLFNNSLSGKMPSSLQKCTKLLKIDLSNNEFSGEIPIWLGIHLESLKILSLRANSLSGSISSSICRLNSLQILDLSNNLFSGKIPSCVNNFTAMAIKIKSGWVHGVESQELWNVLAFGYNGYYTETASVGTKGNRLQYDRLLSLVTNLDLSRNNLSGEIPVQLTRLAELRSLNLSGNHLNGLIPSLIGEMKQLESLDLSRNSLSGEIPNSMSVLTSLNFLNVSYNNLTGGIPQSTQITSLPSSGFIGNRLCGLPLTSNCNDNVETRGPSLSHEEDNGVDKSHGVDWLYVSISSGYVLGLAIVFNVMVFMKTWRDAIFGTADNWWNKVYIYAILKVKKHG